MKGTNPFLTTGYAGPDTFCDREAETRELLDAAGNGRNVTLVAPGGWARRG